MIRLTVGTSSRTCNASISITSTRNEILLLALFLLLLVRKTSIAHLTTSIAIAIDIFTRWQYVAVKTDR